MTTVKYKLLSSNAKVPKLMHYGDACFDLYSAEETHILPGETKTIFTDLAIEMTPDYEAVIRGRSGITKHGILVQIGTIDSNYRGNIGITLYNSTDEYWNISKGDRIAQMAIREVPTIVLEEVEKLSDSDRGDKGYGSTGK